MNRSAEIPATHEHAAVRDALVFAMEQLCLTRVERFLDAAPCGATVEASVAFHGPRRGALTVALPIDAVHRFASGFLPPAHIYSLAVDDFVAELANIVCGGVLPRLFGRELALELSPPLRARACGRVITSAIVQFTDGWVAATLHEDAG